MWKPGPPVIITATNGKQLLVPLANIGLIKALRFMQHWSNTGKLYLGDSTLDPAATPPVGITHWLPPPAATGPAVYAQLYETEAPNGMNANQFYVSGTTGEIVLWSYLEQ